MLKGFLWTETPIISVRINNSNMVDTDFIGRRAEIAVLEEALRSKEAEMISIIGRRRIGKTFLVRTVYEKQIDFELSGIQDAQGDEQLRNFFQRLKEFFPETKERKAPKDWLDAFFMLTDHLEQKQKQSKKVVFLDEVPWMATHKSGFLRGLSYFWNSWAVRKNVVVVLCGSAVSWMINKVLRNKGGLHNRVTKRIRLKPFSLLETKQYLEGRAIVLDHYQLVQLYMVMGGIPHYLKEVKNGRSATQNISKICFEEDGILRDEFQNLYPALFQSADYHIAIIRALSEKYSGMTRAELIRAAQLSTGGRITQVLTELAESGFITAYPSYGKKTKEKIYRLTDEYSFFYLRFIEKTELDQDTWLTLSQTQAYKIWCGYAFENICLKHIPQIKKALEIGGVYTKTSSFYKSDNEAELGAQIDLLIDRNDHIINLIETKFHNVAFTISKDYAHKLREKIRIFQESTQTKKQVFLTMITTFGLHQNKHSIGLVASDLDLDIFFKTS
ncbi:MAG: ATP-binding protein [Bacteroidota bacterium]